MLFHPSPDFKVLDPLPPGQPVVDQQVVAVDMGPRVEEEPRLLTVAHLQDPQGKLGNGRVSGILWKFSRTHD
jgi:hypothetical protein